MSSLLSAENLNDFITPGVACIKPAEPIHSKDHIELEWGQESNSLSDNSQNASTSAAIGTTALKKAQISLSDCLACSGCITSAEEVLVAQHSHKEFLNAWNESKEDKIFAVSMSQQVRSSLANAFQVPVDVMDRALGLAFSRTFKFKYIVSVGTARRIVLDEINEEIAHRRKDSKKPVLSSICPGWVLYVEKTHPWLIEYMSKVKSPQAVTGIILKHIIGKEEGDRPTKSIYHLSIMPCFDKKLEAARDDGMVDCVITPKEVVTMFEEMSVPFDGYLEQAKADIAAGHDVTEWSPKRWLSNNRFGWASDEGSESGGYAFSYIENTRQELIKKGIEPDSLELKVVGGKNPDIYEWRLIDKSTGSILAKSGVVNGFKNIQNLVRKLKPDTTPANTNIANKRGAALVSKRRARTAARGSTTTDIADLSTCDFIEMMACPEGCINGGGQIKAPLEDLNSTKSWIQQVKNIYHSLPVMEPSSREMLSNWLESLDFAVTSRDTLLYTSFQAVEKPTDETTIMLTSTW